MDIGDYLNRLNYSLPVRAEILTLRGLQLAHLKCIPFENLDIGLGRQIELSESALWNKLITRKRGGFCYELNGLFASLLLEIGFEVTHLNARDYHEEDAFGIDFDHLTLMVRVADRSTRWLVDVGWGDSFTQPLDIDKEGWQDEGQRAYKVEPFREGYQLWQKDFDGKIERQYFFDLIDHRFPAEYAEACLFHQTSPQSPFTKKRIISSLTEDGRISLDDAKLIIARKRQRAESPVSEEERPALLQEHFGVDLALV